MIGGGREIELTWHTHQLVMLRMNERIINARVITMIMTS